MCQQDYNKTIIDHLSVRKFGDDSLSCMLMTCLLLEKIFSQLTS